MSKIPKIIHQIWSGISEPLPECYKLLGETWKEHYPDWEYVFWDNDKMNKFVKEHYPHHWDIYNRFPYNVQRWDAIRYLILDKIGGMYVDFDYESICNMEELIQDKSCCFALEPDIHSHGFKREKKETIFNNALMLCEPGHPFMKRIIETVFTEKMVTFEGIKTATVLNTTGPSMLNSLYYYASTEQERGKIYLIPAKYVTPFTMSQSRSFRAGERNEELEDCLKEAYAVHYFFSEWAGTND
jgi:mannosyltransferase OCH1-like enzyme